MTIKKRKKPEPDASSAGEKKGATRKNPSKSGGTKGGARRVDGRKGAQKSEPRAGDARRTQARGEARTGARSFEGRRGEPRESRAAQGQDRKVAAGERRTERDGGKLGGNPRRPGQSDNRRREARVGDEAKTGGEPRRPAFGKRPLDARKPERGAESPRQEARKAFGERRTGAGKRPLDARKPERGASEPRGELRRGGAGKRPLDARKPERSSEPRGELRRGGVGKRPHDARKPERGATGARKDTRKPFAERRSGVAGKRVLDARKPERGATGARVEARGASTRKPRAEARGASAREPRADARGASAREPRKDAARGREGQNGHAHRSEPRAEPRAGARVASRQADSHRGETRKLEPRRTDGGSQLRKDTRESRESRKGTRGLARRVDPRAAREADKPEVEGERKPGARTFPPRKSLPMSLVRATKPVERKRPDMSAEPHPGHYLLTCREGSEQDLVDELVLAGIVDPPPRVFAPALVLAPKIPKLEKRPVELAFARQGFPIVQSVHAHDLDEISQRVSRSLRGQLEKASEYALHVWVPDSELGNPLSAMADQLEEKVVAQLAISLPDAKRVEDAVLRRQGSMLFAQVCLIDPERAVAGVTYSNAAISLARGGRTRVRVTGHFPSRAARKIEEAFAWLNLEPGAGELCVDLGAAPGGWTYVLAERRARVIAVDPAQLRPEILAKKGVTHVQQSAFDYKPDAEVDWLFCDMAWRPLEAAALLAKWGRNRWARLMIANIKLPMTKKAEIIARVKHILETEGDWHNIRVKQLYHDRDEITLSAHVK